jgi:cytidine deaminase
MAALSDAAKRGIRVDGSVMYVNTFPCHICARHIIASGVKRVVYVEPYPKSLTEDLFGDSVLVGKNKSQDGKILFEPFTGVSPRIYRFAFELTRKRKVGRGDVARWSKKKANTKLKRYVTSYLAMEIGVVGKLLPKILEAEK